MWSIRILLISLVSVPVLTVSGHAQTYATDRGSLILGGGLSLSSERWPQVEDGETSHTRVTYVRMSPQVQYFVAPGIAVGGSLGLTHSSGSGSSSTSYGIGPQVSYFFGQGQRAAYPYVSVETGYATARGSDSGTIGYGGVAGLLYMLNTAVGLNGSLYYRVEQWTGEDSGLPSEHRMGLSIGVSAFVF
jgi:hypothetical protein